MSKSASCGGDRVKIVLCACFRPNVHAARRTGVPSLLCDVSKQHVARPASSYSRDGLVLKNLSERPQRYKMDLSALGFTTTPFRLKGKSQSGIVNAHCTLNLSLHDEARTGRRSNKSRDIGWAHRWPTSVNFGGGNWTCPQNWLRTSSSVLPHSISTRRPVRA